MAKRSSSSNASSGGSTVEATFDRVKTARDGGAWAISCTEDPRLIIKGPMLDPRRGARIRLFGCRETVHPTFGPQTSYTSYEYIGFKDRRGIAKYLADICDGIGERLAGQIVEAFGDSAIDVLRDTPESVPDKVRGIPPDVARAASEALRADAANSGIVSQLRGAGLGPKLAARVVAAYKHQDLPAILKSDPWRIADDVDGVGFKTADALALALGHPSDSPLRARSGLRHFAAELIEGFGEYSGNTIVPAPAVWAKAASCGIPEPAFAASVSEDRERTRVVRIDPPDPAKSSDPLLSPASLYESERVTADRVTHLARCQPVIAWDQSALDSYLVADGRTLDASQLDAVIGVQKRRMVVVTGGPGTGKSFLLQSIYSAIRSGNKVRVLAPTGKAAVRLSKGKNGIPASTIHLALLRDAHCEHDWKDDRERLACRRAPKGHRKLAANVVAVDESSMVDAELMAWLLSSLDDKCSVILFGDVDQLPPVGAGCPFRDIIQSGKVPVHRLTTVHRTDRQWLKENARLINSGSLPKWGSDVDDFLVVERARAEGPRAVRDPATGEELAADQPAADAIVDLVSKSFPRKYANDARFDLLNDVQVLCTMYERGACGAEPLNKRIREAINPPTSAAGPLGFRVGDKVIQTKNDYDSAVMNGEIGRVIAFGKKGDVARIPKRETSEAQSPDDATSFIPLSIDSADSDPDAPRLVDGQAASEDWICVDFDHEDYTVLVGDKAQRLMLAYAISVHRSQGSQWRFVVVPVVKNHGFMLSRKLIYTAITRAQEMVILVGEADAIRAAVRNVKDDSRDTLLSRWLANGCVGLLPTNGAPVPTSASASTE